MDASTDNIGVTRYEVHAGGAKVGDATGTSATIGGRSPNTAYTFTVRAFDAVGNASDPSTPVTATTPSGGDQVGTVTQLATETDLPWGLDFLPDGSGVYTRRDAFDIVKLSPSGVKTNLGAVPGVAGTSGEGGLLGVEVSPTFAADNYLYVYHTAANDNRIVRIKVQNNALVASSLQVLLTGIPRNRYHNGGRLRFGPDGKLYAGTGDGQNANWAQDLANLGGKVLRLNTDGSAPTDNPFYGNGGNARYVWTYGHRNVQGLAFDGQGRLWQAEFGNSVMDELNLSQKGGNYGWPACEGTSATAPVTWRRNGRGPRPAPRPAASPSSTTPCTSRLCAAAGSTGWRSVARRSVPRRPTSRAPTAGCARSNRRRTAVCG